MAVCWNVAAQQAAAAAPTLTRLYPSGGQRGTTVKVTCSGTFDWPVKIDAPGLTVEPSETKGQLSITIPADFPADRSWVRLYSAEGASPAKPFLIGSLPEVVEEESNNTLADAQPIDGDRATINGVLQAAGDVDGFAMDLPEGSTLVASLAAHDALESPVDAALQIVTSEGFVVAENHDWVGLDPRVIYRIPKSGRYLVRVFGFPSQPNSTIGFAGAENYVYRLTMTTGPFIAGCRQLTVESSAVSDARVDVIGWNIPEGTKLPIAMNESHQERWANDKKRIDSAARIGLVHASGFGGGARVRIQDFPGLTEPDDGAKPLRASPPVSFTGYLTSDHEVDEFQLSLSKGDAVTLFAESLTFDYPVVPLLAVLLPDGTAAADSGDPRTARETSVRFKATVDGEHTIRIHDRYQHGSHLHGYLLTAAIEQSDFELTVAGDSLVVTPDKPAELEVNVQRHGGQPGAIGAIEIGLRGAPPGVTATAVVSEPKGETQKKVKLVITTDGSQPFSGRVQIVGKATDPTTIERLARTPSRLGAAFESVWLTATAK